MHFNSLPDDVIGRIFICLMNDSKTFINLSCSSRRLEYISQTVTTSPEWIISRPIGFNLYLDLDSYQPNLCKEHGKCDEQEWRIGCKCEITAKSLGISNDNTSQLSTQNQNSEDGPLVCYYHRLFCLLNSIHRNFSSIKFKDTALSDRGCLKSVQDSLKLNKTIAEHNIRALVELELYDCDIALDWLNTALNQLTSIRYLALSGVTFTDPVILVEPRFFASKTLHRLRIINVRDYRMTDSIFMYFLENFPAVELDLSATHVEFHKRVIQRFYINANTVESYTAHPSDFILTFPMILLYLKKYQSIVKRFIANKTGINFACLKKMLQDEELNHLKIIVQNCPMITQLERARLSEQVEAEDIARVVF